VVGSDDGAIGNFELSEGSSDGILVLVVVLLSDGVSVGSNDSSTVGLSDGNFDGKSDGLSLDSLGSTVGASVLVPVVVLALGMQDGTEDGDDDPVGSGTNMVFKVVNVSKVLYHNQHAKYTV
jgi:hypothetical protein